MNKKTFLSLSFCLSMSTVAAQAEAPDYEVKVFFGGLIAWVHEPDPGVAWALLADLDYDTRSVQIDDLPPGVSLAETMELHPHFSAMRIFGAKSISYGDSLVANGEPIPLAGFEVTRRLSGGAAMGPVDLEKLADLRTIENHRTNGATARIPKEARKVNRDYLDDPVGGSSTPHLNARVKITDGAMTAYPSSCVPFEDGLGPRPAQYLFKDSSSLNCASTAASTPLAELVEWTFRASGELIFDFRKGGELRRLSIEPLCDLEGCHTLKLEIVNASNGKAIMTAPSLENADTCEGGHLRSFEAYYWFTEKPPFYWYRHLKPPVPYYSPCPAAGFTAGDPKCPMIELEP